jgi:RNA polymerase sigma factor (sigma-70 family)
MDPDDAFAGWYRSNRSRVAAAIYAATGNMDVATEATDEAFVRAFERWDRVAHMDNALGWAYRVALNYARRQLRKNVSDRLLQNQLALARRRCDELEVPYELWSRLTLLTRRQRTAIALRYVADLKERDIAAIMHVAPGTVSRLLHDARRHLAVQIAHDAKSEEE